MAKRRGHPGKRGTRGPKQVGFAHTEKKQGPSVKSTQKQTMKTQKYKHTVNAGKIPVDGAPQKRPHFSMRDAQSDTGPVNRSGASAKRARRLEKMEI